MNKNMKAFKNIFIGMAAMGLFASCSDVLDVENKSSMSEDVIFSTESLANDAIMGIHQSFGETNSYRGRFIPYFGINTDCEIFNNYGGLADATTDKEGSLACYSAPVDNTYMNTDNNAWAKLYEAIERANKGIDSMEKYSDLSDQNMAQLYGEFLTLRAFIYFDLVKAWGDVPYRFEPISSETMYLERTSRVVVLKKCLEDLETAIKNLGWPNENVYTTSTERVNKTFAKGLRARIALFLAGKSAWPVGATETDLSGASATDWEVRYNLANEEDRRAMYQIALSECKDVFETKKINKLATSFREIFYDLCQENTEAGKESVYEIPFSDGRGRVLYTWGVKHSNVDDWTGQAQGGKNAPNPTLWYDYDKEDLRRNITCIPYVWKDGAKTTNNTQGGAWCFGKLRYEWMKRVVTSTNDDGINWQAMRLSDIYMMAAEAENYLNGPVNARMYMEDILKRAYPEGSIRPKHILDAAVASKEAFQQMIEDQRKFEFAGEAIRKVDLIRWGKLKSTLDQANKNMRDLANRTGKYADVPQKVYYNNGLDAAGTDADGYKIYGLERGEDIASEQAKYSNNSAFFCLTIDNIKTDDQNKINKYLDNFTCGNADQHMFWPIWRVFLNSSNGTLRNFYGYGE